MPNSSNTNSQDQPSVQPGPTTTLKIGLEIEAEVSRPEDHECINQLYLRAYAGEYLEKEFETSEACFAYIRVGVERLKMDKRKKEKKIKNVDSDEIFVADADELEYEASQEVFEQFAKIVAESNDENAIIAFNYMTANTPAEVMAREYGRLGQLYDDLKARRVNLANLYAEELGIKRSTFYRRVEKGREALRKLFNRISST